MTRHWAELLTNPEQLARYYVATPPLEGVEIRSAHFDRDGPTLLLRLDLPVFPDRPEPEWVAGECDRFQCHVRFLAVEQVRLTGWPLSGPVDLAITPLEPSAHRRVAVAITARGGDETEPLARFTSNASLGVGHLAAYRSRDATYWHAGRVDQLRLRAGIPDTTDKAFYERF